MEIVAETAPGDAQGWRSMDSAPKDGSSIIAWAADVQSALTVFWDAVIYDCWIEDIGGAKCWLSLTHWKPLAPPADLPALVE